jgi:hypothetical protein
VPGEAAGVAAVGPDDGQAVVCVCRLLKQGPGGGAVADNRGGDHYARQQAEGKDIGTQDCGIRGLLPLLGDFTNELFRRPHLYAPRTPRPLNRDSRSADETRDPYAN